MNIKTLGLSTMAACFVAGAAIMPTVGVANAAGTGDNGPTAGMKTAPYKSDDEKMMYEKNAKMMRPFFTDDSMTKMKSPEDVKKTFAAMDADSQAGMKSACQTAGEKRGSYGSVTVALCSAIAE